jgi:LmbE family N-acetylglucosaminyl deacetylase
VLEHLLGQPSSSLKVLLIAAHPDDETLGAGALLSGLSAGGARLAFVHATDGAPADMTDAAAHGFETRDLYAAAREEELRNAIACLPNAVERFPLGFVDQSLAFRLGDLTDALAGVLRAFHPSVVLSHPYEGGHPDHDSVALATTLALSRATLAQQPLHIEFTSYHLWNGTLRSGLFLQDDELPTMVDAAQEARQLKQRMLRCFVSQRETLGCLDTGAPECFRRARLYDFRRPPHEPPLLYDLYHWGITSDQWLARAAALLDGSGA